MWVLAFEIVDMSFDMCCELPHLCQARGCAPCFWVIGWWRRSFLRLCVSSPKKLSEELFDSKGTQLRNPVAADVLEQYGTVGGIAIVYGPIMTHLTLSQEH